ncbi:type III-A CRISPR-associated protein Cas10/Csm1 [Microbulbifer thermotolerans]|uniref:CRISPR system single-strand-specific deoxyribonuclease Cas10/Csm1 (subtype III-A) n=1 Tax=Microbulbifer thermotolerans TaxID=252514 RepID=A0A143HPJ0_MICTH|nr:type III-A CRISPR-associated protein Cas10/Csm1 [Microbulbifer thermotolerans]AMX03655.1 hypothetical protein A3224_14635 [Microbulbifer thermotolerans]
MEKHPLAQASARVSLAAYLHDLGKFAERAGIAEAERQADDRGNSLRDLNVQQYCPQFKGRYSHIHAAYTAIAMDLLEEHLPDIKSGDCSPFASWSSGSELADGDSLINAAARHHKPETFLQWVVASADRLASGFERSEFEEYNRAEEGLENRSHLSARMEVLLEKIRLSERSGGQKAGSHRYLLRPLSPQALMPEGARDCEPQDKASARAEYARLWEQFKKALSENPIPPSHKGDLNLWLDHFDSLWLTFTHAIPSATAAKVDGRFVPVPADVSLYDHSRTTAALATALWRWHRETGREDSAAAARLRDGSDDEEQKFLLVQGDMTGIQDFIFAAGSQTQKYAAKLLRGRSFMVSLLTECAALYLLESLGLPPTSQVINAAGKFLLVAPNTPETTVALEEARSVINRWFMDHSQGRAGLTLTWLPACAADFRGGQDGFRRLVERLFKQLEVEKFKRLDLCSEETPAVFEGYLERFADGECPLDEYSPAEISHRDVRMSRQARDQIRIGEALAKYDRLLVTWEPVNNRTLDTDIFGYRITFADTGETGSDPVRLWDFSLPQDGEAPLWNGCARRFINAYVPRFELADIADLTRYEQLGEEPPNRDEIKSLNHLACEDRRKDSEGGRQGVTALHSLKGDVDNLGQIFQRGLEKPSFAKMAALSRQMNFFFALWLPWRCRERFRNSYTVFAGGDDFFLIGPWYSQLKLAEAMRKDFANYVAGNPDIHFSAGFHLGKPGLPVRRRGQAAEEALDASKAREGKDSVTCYGETVSWSDFCALLAESEELRQLKEEFSLSGSFVYSLLQLVDMAGEEKAGNPRGALWRSQLAYRVQRHVGDRLRREQGETREAFEARRRQWVESLNCKLANAISTWQSGYRIALCTHLYQYRH